MQQFRRLTVADLDLCTALAVDRDWPPETGKWRFLLTVGEGYGLDAPDGDGLAAAFILTRYGDELAAVSMVLVAERYGRQGIGERLMRFALAECGEATAFLCATEIGRPVYERVGFVVDGLVTAYKGRYVPSGARAELRPLGDVASLDREVFGADRSALLKLLPDFAERAYATADGRGYAASWRKDDTLMVGPVVADDLDTAAALVDAVVGDDSGPVRLDTSDPAMEALVRARGLEPYFEVVTMTYGGRPLPGDRARIRALFMQALG